MGKQSRHLTFLLQCGITSSLWNRETGILTLTFRQPRVFTVFCGLCCFIDALDPQGRPQTSKPMLVKDLIQPPLDPARLTLRLRIHRDDGTPTNLAVFLPEFLQDVASGNPRESYRVSFFAIPLET